MLSDITLQLLLLLTALYFKRRRDKKKRVHMGRQTRRPRRWGVRPLNSYRKRFGRFLTTFQVMKYEDPEEFYKYTRMTGEKFDYLSGMLEDNLPKKRKIVTALSASEMLALTLGYMSQGGTMKAVARCYLRGHSTVSITIRIVCNALWTILCPLYLAPPTYDEWTGIVQQFFERWNLCNCLGCIDGKHCYMRCPRNSGTRYYCYKKRYSILLMAICDANYCFTFVDIGAPGICGDSMVFRTSTFGKTIIQNRLNCPLELNIPNTNVSTSCYFVGDDAFPLRKNILKPFSGKSLSDEQRIFNYRLSRARNTIENTFGHLVQRWQVLEQTIKASPKTVEAILKAIVVLHNFLRKTGTEDDSYSDGIADEKEVPPRQRRQANLQRVQFDEGRTATREAKRVRSLIARYVSGRGAVSWQRSRVYRTS